MGATGDEPAGSLGLLQQAPEGPADCVSAGQHSAVATAAGVPAHVCQAAAWGCSPICYAPGHLRCAHIKQLVPETPPGGWKRGAWRYVWGVSSKGRWVGPGGMRGLMRGESVGRGALVM